jgi:hypothetical protein
VNLSGISDGAGDPADDTITVSATSDTPGLVPNPTVNYTSGAATGSLSFTPVANTSGTATITVTVKNDAGTANGGHDTTTETFKVNVGFVNQAPLVSPIADVDILENAGAQTVNLTGLSVGPGNPSSETLAISAASDTPGLVLNPMVSYTSGAKTGALSFTPVANASGTATITVTLKNSGGTSNGGSDATTETFKANVGFVNQPPTIDSIADVNTFENAPLQALNLTGISAGPGNPAGETVTITASSDTPGLVPNPVVNYTSGAAAGTLFFVPVPVTSGTATITVTVKNSGGTANGGNDTTIETFKINVGFVNQPPSFTGGPNLVVRQDSGAQTVTGWATDISPGPANQANETLTFHLVTDNPDLFAVAPAIDSQGNLTYTPTTHGLGTAHLTITLQNSGGTAHGGDDTSPEQTATIQVKVTPGDFDGDGLADPALLETSSSTFFLARSQAGNVAIQFGQGTIYGGSPINVSGDYEGNGTIDPAVFEPSTATFFIHASARNVAFQFGQGTLYGGHPIPVPADYDGDGITDPAVFEPSTATFFIHYSTKGNQAMQFGQGTLFGGHPVPVPGNYDGNNNGAVDPAVFEPSTSTFFIQSTDKGNRGMQFGQGTLYGGSPVPVPGNYDGTDIGTTNPAVFEPSTSTFFIASTAKGNRAKQFGQGTLYGGHPVPVPGNYDGNCVTDPAVFEPSTSTFFIQSATKGNRALQFGQGTLYGGNPVVMPAGFERGGITDPAVFEPSTATFFVHTTKGNKAVQFGQGTNFGGHPVPITSPATPNAQGFESPGAFGLVVALSSASFPQDLAPTRTLARRAAAHIHDLALAHLFGTEHRRGQAIDAGSPSSNDRFDAALGTIKVRRSR